MSTATRTDPKRPVRLELNNSGAWKTLMTLDAGDAVTVSEAEMLTHELGVLYARLGGRMKWRISMAQKNGCVTASMVLREWSPETGWKDA
jgi:hypothetical protein